MQKRKEQDNGNNAATLKDLYIKKKKRKDKN
jgi:hypothetical protein